ncbi:hypothetical protein FB45DRAFT_865090 [Roridomyces roridus]|uniref:Uncharacterized protein n=1 Tax=Roridomyces roridus TaxID=1738132 RepID=A0AAD7BYL4_9AGAR|nr:hypothetical protein FB45DRAFT_865090 [Roridomyces roridus]
MDVVSRFVEDVEPRPQSSSTGSYAPDSDCAAGHLRNVKPVPLTPLPRARRGTLRPKNRPRIAPPPVESHPPPDADEDGPTPSPSPTSPNLDMFLAANNNVSIPTITTVPPSPPSIVFISISNTAESAVPSVPQEPSQKNPKTAVMRPWYTRFGRTKFTPTHRSDIVDVGADAPAIVLPYPPTSDEKYLCCFDGALEVLGGAIRASARSRRDRRRGRGRRLGLAYGHGAPCCAPILQKHGFMGSEKRQARVWRALGPSPASGGSVQAGTGVVAVHAALRTH